MRRKFVFVIVPLPVDLPRIEPVSTGQESGTVTTRPVSVFLIFKEALPASLVYLT